MANSNTHISPPWPQLAAMTKDLKDGILTRILKAGMRSGLTKWRDKYVPLRFSKQAHNEYGFANRSVSYSKRRLKGSKGVFKGALPDFVYTGRLRDSLLKRKPRATKSETGSISYKYSIFGGVMNLLGGQRGYFREVTSTKRQVKKVKPHMRRGSPVSGHDRVVMAKTWEISLSPKTYAQEWALTPQEHAAAVVLVNDETRRILSSKPYLDPRTGKFRQRFMREELLSA
jgi:hypothetical protein